MVSSKPNTIEDVSKRQPVVGELGKATISTQLGISGKDIVPQDPHVPLSKLNRMLRLDGQVGGLYRVLTTPIRGSEFIIHPKDRRSKREANFIQDNLRNSPRDGGMRTPIRQVLSTITRMLLDGFAPHEIVWDIRDGKVFLDKISYRPSHTITAKVNEHGELNGYEQNVGTFNLSTGKNNIDIPGDKILHFVIGQEFNEIYGRSLFEQSFYHYEKKHKLYYITHLAAQLRALGIRKVRSPHEVDPDVQKAVMKAIADLGFNSTVEVPDGWELEIDSLGSDSMDLMSFISHHDDQMAKSVLAQVINIGVGGRVGSFNLSETHFELFVMNLELITRHIAEQFNNIIIPKLIDWNFGTKKYPTIEFLPFNTSIIKLLSQLFVRIAGASNINLTPEFMLEIEKLMAKEFKLDIDYEPIEKRREEQIEQGIDPLSDPNDINDDNNEDGNTGNEDDLI